jgi:hypothetical protein
MPPRGPRSDLCVVVVTTAISRKRFQSQMRE